MVLYLEVRLPTCAHDGVVSQLFSLTWSHNRYRTVCRAKDISRSLHRPICRDFLARSAVV